MAGDGSGAGPGAALEGADAGSAERARVGGPNPLSACRASRTSSSAQTGSAAGRDPGRRTGPAMRELSHFLAVPIHRELAPLAAGTKAEVVDLVGAAVVLEGSDGRAAAGIVFCGPQRQAFLTLAPAGLRGGGHRSVLSRPDSGHLA